MSTGLIAVVALGTQMTNARSVLPKEPDRALVAGVLADLRLAYLT